MKLKLFHCLLLASLFLSFFLNLVESKSLAPKKKNKKKNISPKNTSKPKFRLGSSMRNSLFSKRASAFEKLLAMRVPREDQDIPDPLVVFRIAFASHNKEGSSCPYPLSVADSFQEGTSGDLNEGKGGDYIYLCIGRKRVSELTENENFINQIYLNTNQENCGKLTLIKSTLKSSYYSTDRMSLCVGFDQTSRPWSNIKVLSRKKNDNTPVPSVCKLEITEGKFLCYETADEAPLKIEFSDLNMLKGEVKAAELGKPETVAEIDNDNSAGKVDNTIKRSLMLMKTKTAAWNLENRFTSKVDVKFSLRTPIINVGRLSATSSFEMGTTENRGTSRSVTEMESVDFNCLAPKGKYYKCRATISQVETSVPYEIKRTVTLHNGKKMQKIIKSYFEGMLSSSVKFERCCYLNCDPKTENVCGDWIKDPKALNAQCPKLEGVTDTAVTPANEQTITLDDKFDPLVIVDLQVVIGSDTSCPHGYVHVNQNDSTEKADWDKATYNSNKRLICILKQKVSKLEYPPLNVVKVSKNNKDCGTLIQSSISVTDPQENYICYGHDASLKSPPLRDLIMVTKSFRSNTKNDNFIKNLEFDPVLVKDDYYLALVRENNAPKKVQVVDIKYDFIQMKKQQTGPPKKVKEVIVSSATLTETVKVSKRNEASLKTVIDVGKSVGVSVEGRSFGISASAGLSATSKKAQSTEEKKTEESVSGMTVDCIAQDKKVIKCISSVMEYRMIVPYTAKMQAFDYQGMEMPALSREIKGVSEEVGSTNIVVRNCCLEGCCSGDDADKDQRPHCWDEEKAKSKGKDITCAEVETCFEDKKTTRRRRRF